MTLSTALVLFLQTSFVLLAALAIGYLARRRASVRIAVYRLSLLAVIFLAAGSPWLHERTAPLVAVRWSPIAHSAAVSSDKPAKVMKERHDVVAPANLVSSTPSPAAEPLNLLDYVPWVWMSGIVLLSVHLALGWIALLMVRRRCRPVREASVIAALALAANAARIRQPALAEGPSVGVPFVAGILRPTVYLPENWADQTERDALQAVLRHEVAHIANGDLKWSLLHRLASIPFWPQMFLWALRRPMEAASEELCDGHVLASGISGPRYAECLVNLREKFRAQPCPMLGIGAVTGRSSLGRRVEAILNSKRFGSITLSRPLSVVLCVGALALAASATWLFAKPAAQLRSGPTDGWTAVKPYAGKIAILSEDGKPVEGAKAWLVSQGENDPTSRKLQVAGSEVMLSTENLPPRSGGILVVHAPGHGLGIATLWPAPTPVTLITLPRPVSLEGRLLLPDGKPASGIQVRTHLLVKKVRTELGVQFLGATAIPDLPLAATSGPDGSFRMDGLPPNFTVGYDVEDSRYAQLRTKDRVELTEESVVRAQDTKLIPAAQLSGTVTQDGKPVSGARIGLQSNHMISHDDPDVWSTAITDQAGHYTIGRLPSGAYNVALDQRYDVDAETTARAHEGLRIGQGQSLSGIDFKLEPGALIEGVVRNAVGNPVADIPVGVYGPAHPDSSAWVQVAKTNQEGRFHLRVPAGSQRVYVMDEAGAMNPRTVEVADGSRTTVNFSLSERGPVAPEARVAEVDQDARPARTDPGPGGPIATYGPGQPFYGPVKLPNGAMVQLAYVQDDAAKPHDVWNPDGSQASDADAARSLNMNGFNKNESDVRSLFLRVDITGQPRGDVDCVVQVPHQSPWNVWQTYGDGDNRSLDMASFRAHKSLKVTDMRFGVAAGPYRVVNSCKLGEAPLFARASSGPSVVVLMPQGLEGQDVKLAAYDRDGKRLDLTAYETENSKDKLSGKPSRGFSFSGELAGDISRVELITREYCWTTFKGIQLYPKG